MRWFIKILIFALCFHGTARFCKKQTGSFTIGRITSSLSYHPEWEVDGLSPIDVKKILDQPYHFLGKGAQSFVFASKDGEWVLKFFRHHRLQKHGKWAKDFASYKLAYDKLREETGLVYLHLNKSSHLHHTLDLVDKIGIHHSLDMDQYEFMIQKRAKLVYPALKEWIQIGKVEEAKEALTSLVDLLKTRIRKGIQDEDPDLNTNFGFIGTHTIQVDIGRFRLRTNAPDSSELHRITDNLHQWLQIHAPELSEHLQQEIHKT